MKISLVGDANELEVVVRWVMISKGSEQHGDNQVCISEVDCCSFILTYALNRPQCQSLKKRS